jgi:UDPglucose 6-dehydrogenase
MNKDILIGFIGQGWVGKNYADHFEDRGFDIVRYGLEEQYIKNKEAISECDIVFIAVPTPTTPEGFYDGHLRSALELVGPHKIAIIKSTIPPGTVRKLLADFPHLYIVHAPEFLRESFARHDVDHPERVIVGIPEQSEEYQKIAQSVLDLHPSAPFTQVVTAEEAEFVKYVHNTMGYTLIVYMNMLHDLATTHGVSWELVRRSILANPWYPEKYIDPVHKGGRGAGGGCFIKDFAALREMYERDLPDDKTGIALLHAFEEKNNQLLRSTQKDVHIVNGVYGEQKTRN